MINKKIRVGLKKALVSLISASLIVGVFPIEDAVKTASADETGGSTSFTLDSNFQIDSDYSEGDDGYYYVNIPYSGTTSINLSDEEYQDFVFKVYDEGGKTPAEGELSDSYYDSLYNNSADGTLSLTAPDGFAFQITGSVKTVDENDYLLVNGKYKFGNDAGQAVSFDETFTSVTLQFISDTSIVDEGVDLTVSIVETPKSVNIYSAADDYISFKAGNSVNIKNGKVSTTKIEGTAVENGKTFTASSGEKIQLDITANEGCVLSDIEILDYYNLELYQNGETYSEITYEADGWYTDSATAVFTMPSSRVFIKITLDDG
ncbi:MAG: hypothetical protein K6F77_09650, partial [Lachnospiraceae bacterium]|nr:hypothetical protein [Lachnospiraceae bacterium]